MKTWIRGLLTATSMLATLAAAAAQERQVAEHNCAFTPPAGWTEPDPAPVTPGLVGVYRKPDGTALMMLLVDTKNKPATALDERVAAEIEKGIVDGGGGNRLWSSMSTMGGVKAYDRLGQIIINDKPVSVLMRLAPASGKMYSLQGMSFDGDASKDPDVRAAFESFRFLTPPPRSEPPSAAYRAGYRLGFALAIGAIVVVFLAVIVGVVLVIRKVGRKPNPPPFPPQG